MAAYVRKYWKPMLGAGLSRRESRGCYYEAYLPDPIAGRLISVAGDVAADVADAEAAIRRLDSRAERLRSSEGLARLLLRTEGVASSRIESLRVDGRRLLLAEAARRAGEAPSDLTAAAILANIAALAWVGERFAQGDAITVDSILELHSILMGAPRQGSHGGRLRDEQNWIGGSDINPCGADFVPPPHEDVPALLKDLCRFCSEDSLPAVMQAAVAHAQFETIHPFVDGNGRTGRALIYAVLRRRGLVQRALPPVSLVLAGRPRRYVSGLMTTRYAGDAESPDAVRGRNDWISFFAGACRRASEEAETFEQQVRELEDGWRRRTGPLRRDSTASLLLSALPGVPVITVRTAAELTGRTFQAANLALGKLAQAGIVRPVEIGRSRNRAFEAPDVTGAFLDLERRLAQTGEGDGTTAPAG